MFLPRVPAVSKKGGVAVRRCVSSGAVCLAPSTLFAESGHADVFGFIISYRIRVKLTVAQSPLNANVIAEMPVFIVTKSASDGHANHSAVAKNSNCSSGVIFRNRRWALLSCYIQSHFLKTFFPD